MDKTLKMKIYKGIIQYLLESTDCTLQNIADLSSASIKNIRLIHQEDNELMLSASSEIKLVNLYRIILELNHENI